MSKAFLLNDRFRHHFVLKKENEEEDGKQLLCWEKDPGQSRKFLISFVSSIICPYSQCLVLHFGDDILVMITILVEFVGEFDFKELKEAEWDLSNANRWTETNTDVIRDESFQGKSLLIWRYVCISQEDWNSIQMNYLRMTNIMETESHILFLIQLC